MTETSFVATEVFIIRLRPWISNLYLYCLCLGKIYLSKKCLIL